MDTPGGVVVFEHPLFGALEVVRVRPSATAAAPFLMDYLFSIILMCPIHIYVRACCI